MSDSKIELPNGRGVHKAMEMEKKTFAFVFVVLVYKNANDLDEFFQVESTNASVEGNRRREVLAVYTIAAESVL